MAIHTETFNQAPASPNTIPDWTNWGTFDSLGTTISNQTGVNFDSMFYTPLNNSFQSSVITIGAFNATGVHGANVFMSGDPSTGSAYSLQTDANSGASAFRLYKSDGAGNSFSSLFVSPTDGVAWQTADTIGITAELVGAMVEFKLFKNGIQRATFTDSTNIVTSGSPGFYNFNVATADNDTIDNFVGETFEGGSRGLKDIKRTGQVNLSPNYKTRGAQGNQRGSGKHRSPFTKIR